MAVSKRARPSVRDDVIIVVPKAITSGLVGRRVADAGHRIVEIAVTACLARPCGIATIMIIAGVGEIDVAMPRIRLVQVSAKTPARNVGADGFCSR